MRVLMIEDERDTAEAPSWDLTAEGYVVDLAGNGVDGAVEGDRERLPAIGDGQLFSRRVTA